MIIRDCLRRCTLFAISVTTVLVVEHDDETIEHADYVVDLGPLAGTHGGEVVAIGKPKDIEASPDSLTGKYLSGELSIEVPDVRRLPNGHRIKVKGARAYNLKNIDVGISTRSLNGRDGRFGFGQIDAGRGNPLSGALQTRL